ncbi:hypothetical protein [Bdellovibrio sp. HCB337]|uniref:hypothetical protein n=1 Tax=Bdellovibrio sp. HCB337 TaxID=3394358 RepID=UPI0039A5659C
MYNVKGALATTLVAALLSACATNTVSTGEFRSPAGTGDIDSSSPGTAESYSYKLPITRNGATEERMAYSFWSGEWPMPIIDVSSDTSGTTKISGYTNLRDPKTSDKVSCTVQNGLYHPWSENEPSIINYYTLSAVEDFKVLKTITHEDSVYDPKTKKSKTIKMKIPKGSKIVNVVYYAEGYCGATVKIGKTSRPIDTHCSFIYDNKDLQRISKEGSFSEQWLYMKCEEKDSSGKNVKAFVRDEDLLSQPGIKKGCPAEYGKIQGAQYCGQN